MGNCQAIDNATLVIQHPCGRVDQLYWPVTASEIMKMNPGHYVALLLTTTTAAATTQNNSNNNITSIRITRIKLLRPTDTLVLGHVYRLFTTQEVMKGLGSKKYAKMKKKEPESAERQERMKEKASVDFDTTAPRSKLEKTNQVTKHERNREKTTPSTNSSTATAKSRAWHPSLKSISEAGS